MCTTLTEEEIKSIEKMLSNGGNWETIASLMNKNRIALEGDYATFCFNKAFKKSLRLDLPRRI